MNDQNIQPLTPFISWIDRRANEQSERLLKKIGGTFHDHCSFSQPLPELAVSKLLWLSENEPSIVEHTHSYIPMPTWLGLKWIDIAFTDVNLAGMSGCYDLQSGTWWKSILAITGFDNVHFPIVKMMGFHASIHPNQTLVFAGNDQTCSALAADLQPGEILISLGPATVVYQLPGMKSDSLESNPDAGPRDDPLLPGPFNPNGCFFALAGFFDPRDLVQVRYEMLRRHLVERRPVTELIRDFGVSRQMFYVLLRMFQQQGLAGLLPHKRGPKDAHKCSAAIVAFAAAYREKSPGRPTKELVQEIGRQFGVLLHPRTLERHLARLNKIRRGKSPRRRR